MRRDARGHRHLVRLGLDAVRAVALPVRARGGVRRPSSRPTSSARAWTRRAAGSTRCSRSRRPRSTSPAYRHVIVNELVLDAEGQKMSKSRGNVVEPVGDDRRVRRRRRAAVSARLEPGVAAQAVRPEHDQGGARGKFFNALKNIYAFFAGYAGDWRPAARPRRADRPLVDRWLLSRLDATVEAVHAAWAGYDATAGVRALMEFVVDDVSKWYVRANRAAVLGRGQRRRPRGARDAARGAGHGESAARRRRRRSLSDWLHRALAGTSVHLARFPVTAGPAGAGARGGDGRRAPAGLAGPRRAARSGSSRCGSRWPACRWRCRPRCAGRRSTSCSNCSGSRST